MTEDSENCENYNNEISQTIRDRIFYAARDGHSIVLYECLCNIKNPELRNFIINQNYCENNEKYSPFVIAAKNGREKVIKLLLEHFKPNIETKCTVKFDGHIVSGATALWCAAGSGHLNVVKLLIKHGANVNQVTDTNSTPMRAACFDGRLDIVQYLFEHDADVNIANAYNNTCLMIAAYKGYFDIVEFLVTVGAEIDEQAHGGATALHYAAECGNVEICLLLLCSGATLKKNEYGMTPIITAAERARKNVVEFFISQEVISLTKEEKIDALELMGASFANDKDNYSLRKAYEYLLKAMELRYEDSDNIIRKKLCPPIPAYQNWIECQTIADLQGIHLNSNSMHMESLTIRERILGRKCPDVAHPVVFRGAVCADDGNFDRCEILWLHAVKLRQENKLSVQRDLLRFAQVFSQMLHSGLKLRFANVLTVLESCIIELKSNKEKMLNPGTKDDLQNVIEEYESNVVTVLYLLTISTKIMKDLNQSKITSLELEELHKLVFQLNRMAIKLRDGQTLLHLSVNGVTPVDDFHTNDICCFPCLDTVKLLIHCGASTNIVDCDRNTPLHILTSTTQCNRQYSEDTLILIEDIIKIFVNNGVHLDTVNIDGLTAAQISSSIAIESVVKKYETNQICLKCLAARTIAQHKINYKENVPLNLESFIRLHSAEKYIF